MTVPYTLLLIKPLTVGRGDAPEILQKILEDCPVALRMFRAWSLCDSTLLALSQSTGLHAPTLDYEVERIHALRNKDSWICVFTHLDRETDPTDLLNEYCGPVNPKVGVPGQLRFDYGGFTKMGNTAHPSDTVFHIASPERVNYEANALFLKFNEQTI